MSLKNTHLTLLFIIVLYNITAKCTLGDSSVLKKNINFYGTLETFVLQKKNVEQITFWNKSTKIQIYEAPNDILLKNRSRETSDKITLDFDPSKESTIASIELQEIVSLKTIEKLTFIISRPDKTVAEFALIEIWFHGNDKSNLYFISSNEKIYCKEINGNETIELEVPITSIKNLIIENHYTTNQNNT